MLQLSPDTDVTRWDVCSGYHHDDGSILGFSHTHLSGTGIGDMLDVLVVPAVGEVCLDPGTLERPENSYRARFAHADERASPGYYRVLLKERDIEAELTVTAWMPARFAASIWLRMSASSGLTMSAGPWPWSRRTRVAIQ